MLIARELRNTRVRQSRGALRPSKNSYCPLGVIASMLFEDKEWQRSDGSKIYFRRSMYSIRGETQFLPREVMEWSGIRTSDGRIEGMYRQMPERSVLQQVPESIVHLNDKRRLSFSEIADLIEEHWEKL